jgi:alpha-glucosidase
MTGRASLRTMTEFAAMVPWRVAAANLNLLSSHDTPRLASVVTDPAHRRLAVGLLATWVGVPSTFAGDELGFAGSTTHEARAPIAWDAARWDHDALAMFTELLSLRRSSPAIRHGGLRPVHAGQDTITFLRESASQRVLVHAARRPHAALRLSARALGVRHGATSLLGGDDLVPARGRVTLPVDGPAFGAWELH